MRFELEHLDSYDDSSLLNELRRVAGLIHTPKLTIGQFTALAKVHGSTLQKRFGGWKGALEAAGLGDRFDDASLSKNRDDILRAIKATAEKLQKNVLTRQEFQAHTGMTDGPVRRLFGSWKAALVAAELGQSSLGKRYTDEDCFENMLTLGRIASFQAQVAHLRNTDSNPVNYRAAVSGFLAEIDRMQLEVREYLSLHPRELATTV